MKGIKSLNPRERKNQRIEMKRKRKMETKEIVWKKELRKLVII